MEYMLMLYVDEAGWPKLSKAEQEQGMAAYRAYSEALRKAGVYKSGSQAATPAPKPMSGPRRSLFD